MLTQIKSTTIIISSTDSLRVHYCFASMINTAKSGWYNLIVDIEGGNISKLYQALPEECLHEEEMQIQYVNDLVRQYWESTNRPLERG